MIYAGTLILNLLAATVDNKFIALKTQPSENATLATMETKDNSVRVLLGFCK